MLITWIVFYIAVSLFYKWILSWGGAHRIEGWLSVAAIGWFALDWSAEKIRLFALIMWIIFTVIFIIGLFNPAIRQEYFM